MIDIAKKKLPSAAIAVIVYISYCAAGWFAMRGTLAYYGWQYGFPAAVTNDAVAFFLGGLIPFAIYELLSVMVFKQAQIKCGGDTYSLRYGLNYAVIAANVLLFGLKFMYLAVPLYASIIDAIIDPVVTVAVVGLYMWYAFSREYVDKTRFRFILVPVMSAFVTVYGLLSVLGIIMSVMA